MFFPRNFTVSGLMFKSAIHFEFIFIYGRSFSFILLLVDIQLFQHHLIKRLSLMQCIFLVIKCVASFTHPIVLLYLVIVSLQKLIFLEFCKSLCNMLCKDGSYQTFGSFHACSKTASMGPYYNLSLRFFQTTTCKLHLQNYRGSVSYCSLSEQFCCCCCVSVTFEMEVLLQFI